MLITLTIKTMTSNIIQISRMVMIAFFAFQSCQPLEEESILLITTDNIEYLSEGLYQFSGTIESMGEKEITQHGFCWGEAEKPDIDGQSVLLGPPASKGKFSNTVSGLSAGTTHYVRAYAIVDSKPVYADEKSFTTEPASENIVIDIDGNTYGTVQIGEQIWMAENLKVPRYADGTSIPKVEDQQTWFHFTRISKAYCDYNNVLSNGYLYGALYTWPAAVRGILGTGLDPGDIQGICPDGWHIPSDSEWKQLELFLGMSQDEVDREEWRGVDQGGKLKQEGIQLWESPNTGSTDELGFKALPGGYRHGSGEFMGLGNTARFWSSSENGYGWFRGLDYDNASVNRDYSGVYRGYSVRCVKDQ